MTNTWTCDTYRQNAAYVPALGAAVFELLDPKPRERILDLGCGEGSLTQKIVEAGAIVVGIDASEAMIAGARVRGLDAHVMNVEQMPFDLEFDAVFSNAVLHWVRDHDAMLSGVHRALKPGRPLRRRVRRSRQCGAHSGGDSIGARATRMGDQHPPLLCD